MYWKKEKLDYEILVFPLEKPIEKLTPKQMDKFFHWYIEQIPQRVAYLENYSGVRLDYSLESLVPIWHWFLKHAKLEKTPLVTRLNLLKSLKEDNVPREIAREIQSESKYQFSLQTEYIMNDITMYFGEVGVRNYDSIYWGYETSKRKIYNRPLIMGFVDRDYPPPNTVAFDPARMVRDCAEGLMIGDANKNDLLDLYRLWERMT